MCCSEEGQGRLYYCGWARGTKRARRVRRHGLRVGGFGEVVVGEEEKLGSKKPKTVRKTDGGAVGGLAGTKTIEAVLVDNERRRRRLSLRLDFCNGPDGKGVVRDGDSSSDIRSRKKRRKKEKKKRSQERELTDLICGVQQEEGAPMTQEERGSRSHSLLPRRSMPYQNLNKKIVPVAHFPTLHFTHALPRQKWRRQACESHQGGRQRPGWPGLDCNCWNA